MEGCSRAAVASLLCDNRIPAGMSRIGATHGRIGRSVISIFVWADFLKIIGRAYVGGSVEVGG